MTPQERDVLLPLLDRLRQTRVQAKDAEADQLIRQTLQAQPDAPYVLAQTVLMQDYALHAAQDRVHALEQQLAQHQAQHPPEGQHQSGGGFLSGLFGARAPSTPPGGYATPGAPNAGSPNPGYANPAASPGYGAQIASAVQPGAGGPSFLRGAAQAAAGVAGGVLLAQGLEGLFEHHGGGSGFLGNALGGTLGNTLGGTPGDALGGAGDLGAPGGFGGASVDQFVQDASDYPADQGAADPGSADDADADNTDFSSADTAGDPGGDLGGDAGNSGDYAADDGGFDGGFDDSTS